MDNTLNHKLYNQFFTINFEFQNGGNKVVHLIVPSHSPWSSPVIIKKCNNFVVIIKKKDGKDRFCIDFRCVKNRIRRLSTVADNRDAR